LFHTKPKTRENRIQLAIVFGLIAIGATLRVLRHVGWLPLPPNVAPVSALAFIAAAYLPRRWGILVPLGLMVASDMAIGGYDWRIMAAVYGSFGVSYGLGLTLRKKRNLLRLGGITLTGSLMFFLLTNAAVWLWSGFYHLTLLGLGQAYLSGLPFLRNTVIGDLGYSLLGFGLLEGVMVYWRRYHPAYQPLTNG